MADGLSVIFVGGIADSGKSALIAEVTDKLTDIKYLKISDSLRVVLERSGKHPKPELGPEVTFIDWKSEEPQAIVEVVKHLQEYCGPGTETIIINTHFATYSPGGFMAGLDPASIVAICEACLLTKSLAGRAAVVLVDIGIADVLHRREQRWTDKVDGFPRGSALVQDLEFNRIYALQYYGVLTSLLGRDRVLYHRIFVDYTLKHAGELKSIPEFKHAVSGFGRFLYSKGFSKKEWIW